MSTTTATAAKGRLNKEVTFFFLYRHCDGAFPNGTSFLFLFLFFSLFSSSLNDGDPSAVMRTTTTTTNVRGLTLAQTGDMMIF